MWFNRESGRLPRRGEVRGSLQANREARRSAEGMGAAESGSAMIEMIFCTVFVFLLIAFVVQQVQFALDFSKAADELYYDQLRAVRAGELFSDPGMTGVSNRTVALRDTPFLRSMLDIDTSAITKSLGMRAAGGTKMAPFSALGDTAHWLADNPAGASPPLPQGAWQPLLAVAAAPQKIALMIQAGGIGYSWSPDID